MNQVGFRLFQHRETVISPHPNAPSMLDDVGFLVGFQCWMMLVSVGNADPILDDLDPLLDFFEMPGRPPTTLMIWDRVFALTTILRRHLGSGVGWGI